MTQSIVIQVGQCGNQIGCRFWDLALREHASTNKKGVYDEAMSSFFRNVDARYENPVDIPVADQCGKIRTLKARAVLVDMEEGVVSEMLKGPLRDVFDHRQLITDVSGSGNNCLRFGCPPTLPTQHTIYFQTGVPLEFDVVCPCIKTDRAVGHKFYGGQYRDQLVESIRRTVETCDCLQCFFVLHSMGGGTGSGVGTCVLNLLQDEYPDVHRFVTAVYPSLDDDVITSPYNSVLAMRQLTENADCVLPVENQALVDIVNKIYQALPPDKFGKRVFGSNVRVKKASALTASEGCVTRPSAEKPFDGMNNVVANMLLNLTSSARFEGSLNVDLNEITMNLVPFPRLHYLLASQTPLYALADIKIPPRRLDQMFSDAFSHEHQLLKAEPKQALYLACALMVRGDVQMSDIRRNIERLKPSLHFIHWNQEGWKTGLCSVPPVGHPYSLLTLANNTCVRHNFTDLRDRFSKLFKRKAHIHHYTQVDGMEVDEFGDSFTSMNELISDYENLEKQMHRPQPVIPRLQIAS